MKKSLSKKTTLILCGGLLLVICTLTYCTKDKTKPAFSSYSAKDLVKGVIFLEGPAVDDVPSLKQMQVLKAAQLETLSSDDQKIINDRAEEKIDEIILAAVELYPSFLNNFKSGITSGNPQTISKTISEAQDVFITSIIYHNTKSKSQALTEKKELLKAFKINASEINDLVANVKANKISENELNYKLHELLGEALFPRKAFIINKSSKQPVNDLKCLALNVGLFVNVGILVNVIALVNVEVGFNVHQAAFYHTYTEIEVEIAGQAGTSSLDSEKLYADIAENL